MLEDKKVDGISDCLTVAPKNIKHTQMFGMLRCVMI